MLLLVGRGGVSLAVTRGGGEAELLSGIIGPGSSYIIDRFGYIRRYIMRLPTYEVYCTTAA